MKNRDEDSKTTCHRLESARSLLAKFGGSAAGDAVSVSLIRFENEAAEIAKNKSIDKFLNDDLTFDKFCGGNNGANFQDAFEKAASTLAAISPVVVASTQIYLLTRGDPTKSNSGTDNSGARAGANKIYEINPSIALNTLIVGNISNGDQELMVELAKSESRVMNVEKASEMPTKILTFQNGPHNPSSATANDFTAKISNGSESRALKVLKISKHPTRHSAFRYELEPFTPYSTTGSRVKNVVTVQDRQSKVEAQIEFEF